MAQCLCVSCIWFIKSSKTSKETIIFYLLVSHGIDEDNMSFFPHQVRTMIWGQLDTKLRQKAFWGISGCSHQDLEKEKSRYFWLEGGRFSTKISKGSRNKLVLCHLRITVQNLHWMVKIPCEHNMLIFSGYLYAVSLSVVLTSYSFLIHQLKKCNCCTPKELAFKCFLPPAQSKRNSFPCWLFCHRMGEIISPALWASRQKTLSSLIILTLEHLSPFLCYYKAKGWMFHCNSPKSSFSKQKGYLLLYRLF